MALLQLLTMHLIYNDAALRTTLTTRAGASYTSTTQRTTGHNLPGAVCNMHVLYTPAV